MKREGGREGQREKKIISPSNDEFMKFSRGRIPVVLRG